MKQNFGDLRGTKDLLKIVTGYPKGHLHPFWKLARNGLTVFSILLKSHLITIIPIIVILMLIRASGIRKSRRLPTNDVYCQDKAIVAIGDMLIIRPSALVKSSVHCRLFNLEGNVLFLGSTEKGRNLSGSINKMR